MGVTRRARDMDEFRGAVAPPEDTPYSRHFARLDATMEQQKGIGRILVRGIGSQLIAYVDIRRHFHRLRAYARVPRSRAQPWEEGSLFSSSSPW